MPFSEARKQRRERYERWYPLFLDEVRLLVRKTTRVVAIGNAVAGFLRRKQFEERVGTSVEPIMHYSSQAAFQSGHQYDSAFCAAKKATGW